MRVPHQNNFFLFLTSYVSFSHSLDHKLCCSKLFTIIADSIFAAIKNTETTDTENLSLAAAVSINSKSIHKIEINVKALFCINTVS